MQKIKYLLFGLLSTVLLTMGAVNIAYAAGNYRTETVTINTFVHGAPTGEMGDTGWRWYQHPFNISQVIDVSDYEFVIVEVHCASTREYISGNGHASRYATGYINVSFADTLTGEELYTTTATATQTIMTPCSFITMTGSGCDTWSRSQGGDTGWVKITGYAPLEPTVTLTPSSGEIIGIEPFTVTAKATANPTIYEWYVDGYFVKRDELDAVSSTNMYTFDASSASAIKNTHSAFVMSPTTHTIRCRAWNDEGWSEYAEASVYAVFDPIFSSGNLTLQKLA